MTATMPLEVVTRRMQVWSPPCVAVPFCRLRLRSMPMPFSKYGHLQAWLTRVRLPVVQIQGAPGHPVRYSSMADCCRTMLREEGASAFWRGTLSSFMKVLIALFRVEGCLVQPDACCKGAHPITNRSSMTGF